MRSARRFQKSDKRLLCLLPAQYSVSAAMQSRWDVNYPDLPYSTMRKALGVLSRGKAVMYTISTAMLDSKINKYIEKSRSYEVELALKRALESVISPKALSEADNINCIFHFHVKQHILGPAYMSSQKRLLVCYSSLNGVYINKKEPCLCLMFMFTKIVFNLWRCFYWPPAK